MLRKLLGYLAGASSVERTPRMEKDLRMAWAALIWQTMVVDGVLEKSEESKAVRALAHGLEIEEGEAEILLREASGLNEETELRPLVELAVKHLAKDERRRIIEAMVDVAKADGELEMGEAAILDFVSKRFGIEL